MADIALVTADKVNVGTLTALQYTGVANAAITAGAPCYLLAATGKLGPADANGAAPINSVFGVATRTVAAGEALTVVIIGYMDGWDFTDQDYGEEVYLSDTVGRLADAPGTTPVHVGTVVPVFGTTLGTGADKVLLVNLGPAAQAAGAIAGIAAIAALTDNTSATANDTVENVPAAVAAATDTTAASLTSVNTALTAIENNIADLAAKVNAIIAAAA